MPTNISDKIKKLGPARRRRVQQRAEQLLREEMTLRELRQARKLTQVKIAKELGISQDSVSRLEQRSDILLSTLRRTVEAMGGKLSLVAEFMGRQPVVLAGFGDAPAGSRKGRR
jgi:transcriptional regulator with XRE-family HTH domain